MGARSTNGRRNHVFTYDKVKGGDNMKNARDKPIKASDFLYFGFLGIMWVFIALCLIGAGISVFQLITSNL